MKLGLTVLALTISISGCAPAVSIRPFYTDEDQQKPVVEPRIEGEWISPNTEEPDKAGREEEPWLRWKITPPDKPGQAYSTYSVEFRLGKPDPGEGDKADSYDVRLVAVGNKLFFDAEFSYHTEGKAGVGPEDVLGLVPAHLVGRIWIQQDFLRIALLKPDWVENNWAGGFYKFSSSKYGDDSIVITGTTQELRDFLSRNADNSEVFAYVVYLCRPGTDCAARAAEDELARSPYNDDVLAGAAKFFFARHNYARTVTLQRHRVELDSEDFTRHSDLSDTLFFLRDFAGARRELAQVQELTLGEHPKPLGPDAQSAYASASEEIVWSYFLEGKYAEAVDAAKKCKPGEKHYSVSPVLLSYFSLLRLGRREAAESLLKDETAKFRGSAEELTLMLDAQGKVTQGFPYSDPKSEELRRASFFGGLRDVAMGRADTARIHLGYAASGEIDNVVALAARIEIERLETKPGK